NPPGLSDDVFRYVWEGGLVAEGKSPYAHAPSSPERAPEREAWPRIYREMNNKDVSAAYPPAAQVGFAVVSTLAGGPAAQGGERAVLAMRIAFALADLAVLGVILVALRRRGMGAARAVIWGWSPLIVFEFAGAAHFDSLGILALLAGLVVLERDPRHRLGRVREGLGNALLATGVLVKLLPLFVVPFTLRESRRRGFAALVLVAVALLWSVPILVSDDGATGLFGGIGAYASRWESFSLVFRFVDAPLRGLGDWIGGDGVLAREESRRLVARTLVALAWGGVALRCFRRRMRPLDAAPALLGAFLVLTPTLHPWYLAWVLAFLALRPSFAWPFLVAMAPLLYWPLTRWHAEGIWVEPGWLWPVVGLPFLLLLGREAWEARRTALRDDAEPLR
ncbi:MAG TPA: DUF2029 domain-containing protein, partial [Planctomycetes bacterium]|nr:DUF2029 domain-containing protein [Planctomycetota bacterium]